jgi:hypothetical protein
MKSFLRFYAAARSGLGACGYHEELLPTLSTARIGFDICDHIPIVDEDLITVGKTMEMDEPPREHWQTQHNALGMNLDIPYQNLRLNCLLKGLVRSWKIRSL